MDPHLIGHVDDYVFTGSSSKHTVKQKFNERCTLTNLIRISRLLGMKSTRNHAEHTISLS